jgi:hypothetical protein
VDGSSVIVREPAERELHGGTLGQRLARSQPINLAVPTRFDHSAEGISATRTVQFQLTCPYHDDGFWADLKAGSPAEWADAVDFDRQIRHGSARANADGQPLRGRYYLHAQRVPLDQVALRPRRRSSSDDTPGCGPFTCPHPGEAVDPDLPEVADAAATAGREVA